MKIREAKGHVVHSPLSYGFHMLELGGSYIQKYDTITGNFIPNRELTPYLLKPQLTISDPDKLIPDGEYSSRLVNCIWTVKAWNNGVEVTLEQDEDYTIDNNTHALTFMRNVAVSELVHLEFKADYVNTLRSEVQHFSWFKDLSTVGEAIWNVSLKVDAPSKMDLSPFKNRGRFNIMAQLMNGDNDLPDELCIYQWQYFDGDNWTDIPESALWYVAGKDAKGITIDQDYLQRAVIRVLAYPIAKPSEQKYHTILLRRWYGQWEERIELMQGKYVFVDDTKAAAQVVVANRQGDIASPCRYFDIEIFFALGNAEWKSVAYGEEAIVQRADMATAEPKFGVICRELSAYLPIELEDGSLLAGDDEELITAQFPTSEREV